MFVWFGSALYTNIHKITVCTSIVKKKAQPRCVRLTNNAAETAVQFLGNSNLNSFYGHLDAIVDYYRRTHLHTIQILHTHAKRFTTMFGGGYPAGLNLLYFFLSACNNFSRTILDPPEISAFFVMNAHTFRLHGTAFD